MKLNNQIVCGFLQILLEWPQIGQLRWDSLVENLSDSDPSNKRQQIWSTQRDVEQVLVPYLESNHPILVQKLQSRNHVQSIKTFISPALKFNNEQKGLVSSKNFFKKGIQTTTTQHLSDFYPFIFGGFDGSRRHPVDWVMFQNKFRYFGVASKG